MRNKKSDTSDLARKQSTEKVSKNQASFEQTDYLANDVEILGKRICDWKIENNMIAGLENAAEAALRKRQKMEPNRNFPDAICKILSQPQAKSTTKIEKDVVKDDIVGRKKREDKAKEKLN